MKTGGRKKGIPNKTTIQLEERARALGVDFFEIICLFAKGDWQALGYTEERYVTGSNDHGTFHKYTIDPAIRAKCALDGANFLYPKRKAVEMSSDPENPIDFVAKLDKEEMKELIQVARGVSDSK